MYSGIPSCCSALTYTAASSTSVPVTRSALTLGTRLTDAVEVVKGLTPGQIVVRTGHQKLFEGAKVIPVTSRPAGETAGVAQ